MGYSKKLGTGLSSFLLLAAVAAISPNRSAAMENTGMMQKAADNRTVVEKTADAWITTKVKSEFAATEGIKSTDISVTTHEGAVTLTGPVANAKTAAKAKRVAERVKGVKSVDISGLTIGLASK